MWKKNQVKQRQYLLLTLVLFANAANAQFYRPFPEGEAIWTISSAHFVSPPPYPVFTDYCSYIIQSGDTQIANTTYHKIFRVPCNDTALGAPYPFADTGYLGALRQDVSLMQVYIFLRDDSIERLLYDFSNDSIGSVFPNTIQRPDTNTKFIGIDTVILLSLNGISLAYEYRDDSVFVYPGTNVYSAIVEGVGGVWGGLITNAGPFIAPGTTDYLLQEGVVCMSEGDELIWHDYNTPLEVPNDTICILASTVGIATVSPAFSFHVTPNPVNTYLYINYNNLSNSSNYHFTVYDMLGQCILSSALPSSGAALPCANWQPGIYIWQVFNELNGKLASGKLVKDGP